MAVTVWCATCHKRPRLGEVRRSSYGLVFDSRLPGAIGWEPGQRDALMDAFRERGSGWLPIPVAVGRCVVLLDDPDDSEVPAVECQGHRIELDTADLIAAAGRQANLRRAVNLTITHPEHTAQ